MAESGITKKVLAASLKKLMIEKPFEKISISEICIGCDMNHKSFYYHFRDMITERFPGTEVTIADISPVIPGRTYLPLFTWGITDNTGSAQILFSVLLFCFVP